MCLLSTKTNCFNCLPNEIILIIWEYLGNIETIKIFGSMEYQRYTKLLEKYCYKYVNFRETSLSTFHLYCSHLFNKIRLNVETLILGHQYSFSQLRLFTQMRPASISVSMMFPKLRKLVLYHIPEMSCDDLEPYLSIIPFLQHLQISRCSLTKSSFLICSNLLGHKKSQLKSCILDGDTRDKSVILHEPIPSSYQVQQSLINIQIQMQDFISLKNLLQFLPKLLKLDVLISSDITNSDNDLFVSCICPCIYLRKLTFRMCGIVKDFPSVVKFILLFSNSLIHINLSFIHKDLAYHHSLVYIDGNLLFDKLLFHMSKLEKINFCIRTSCFSNEQTNLIIKSFQTEYWRSMLIGCYYDRLYHRYVIFSLPYVFSEYFVVTSDIMNTKFNQSEYQLNSLIPMLIKKFHTIAIHIEQNEKLTSSFISFLTQGNYRGHILRVVPHTFYQFEQNENNLVEYDELELLPITRNHLREELINTTMTWLKSMPHLRSLNIDTQMLLKLVPIINRYGTINRFLSLERLIVRQLNIPLNEDTLSVIVRLSISSSLREIRILRYKILNSQSIDNNNFVSNICQICCNMYKLETITIQFEKSHSLFDNTILEELVGIEKKNCLFECIYVSDNIIQFWLEK